MLAVKKEYAVDRMDKNQHPAAFCKDGDIVIIETRDCYDDNDITEENPMGSRRDCLENPSTGPLYIEGAEPGDVLKIEILTIQLRGYGIMRTSPSCGAFCERYLQRTARRFSLEQNQETKELGFWFNQSLWLRCSPMVGVIGTAPKGEGVLTITPGEHGGNMDCTRIREGAVLYLPVNAPGALLSLGDLHAKMGDGEVMICGLETAGKVTLRISVIKQTKQNSPAFWNVLPFLAEGEEVMTIQSEETLDQASREAAGKMEQFLCEAAEINDVDAGMLLSLLGNLTVCQIVNPKKTVRCEFPLSVLETYGYHLP